MRIDCHGMFSIHGIAVARQTQQSEGMSTVQGTVHGSYYVPRCIEMDFCCVTEK